jgi:hypothetical protein
MAREAKFWVLRENSGSRNALIFVELLRNKSSLMSQRCSSCQKDHLVMFRFVMMLERRRDGHEEGGMAARRELRLSVRGRH